jgi:glycosyltransferase involved in cell wall biosynthesis
MSCRPLISVVIPTYNRAQKTIAAIESVLAQTYPHREIIVIDDGSTDGSGEAIQRFLSQRTNGNDQTQQIHYFNQPNQGPSAARNTGIEKARGEYIAFLDSDDVWLPEKLEWQMRAIEQFKNDCGACFTDAKLVNNSGADMTIFRSHGRHYEQTMGIEPDAVRLLARSFCGYWMSSLLARTDLVKQIGGFDPVIFYCDDRDFYFRLSLVTSFAYVNKTLVKADRNASPNGSDGRTWENVDVQLRMLQYMLEKWLRTGATLPPDVRRAAARNLRDTHSKWTNWYLETGRYDEARQAVSRAIKCELTFGLTVKWTLTWLAPTLARRITPKATPYL